MTHAEAAEKIIEFVGGNENIISYMNCMTRLRIDVADKKKVNKKALESIEMVKGVSMSGTICQVVLLHDLEGVCQEMEKLVVLTQKNVKKSIKDQILNFLSSVFTPLIPVLIACGLLQGIMALINQFNWLSPESSTYIILNTMSMAGLYFYPILIAFSSARFLGSNPYITAMIAMILLHPDFLAMADSSMASATFFGLPVRLVNYSQSVFPMLLSAWVVYFVEKVVNKYIPNVIKTSLAPFLVLFIAAPISIIVTAPVGSYLSILFEVVFNWLYTSVPILAGLVVGAFASLFVMTGMHLVLVVLALTNLSAYGFDVLFPILHLSTTILGSIAFGCALRIKSKEDRALAVSAGILGVIFGLSEPALYGVVIRYKRPLVPMIGVGAIVGAISMLLQVKSTALANGIFNLPGFFLTLPQYLVCFALALCGGFICAYLYGVEETPIKI